MEILVVNDDPEILDALTVGMQLQWQAAAVLSADAARAIFSNMHLAEPSWGFLLARALGVLPAQVLIVGCQPQDCEELSAPVEPVVAIAVGRIGELVRSAVEQAV
jgi:hypothetical protein